MEDYEENEEYEEYEENEEYEKNEEYKKYEDSDESDESDEYKENYKIIKDSDPEDRYFPITSNVNREDDELWDIIEELSKPYYGVITPYYDEFIRKCK
eukprot:jgi/Orpsp1_1/1186922/evm.model.d7180000054128.1